MTTRIPPHSNETEEIAISCMLYDDYGLSYGITELAPEMFYRADNRVIFQAVSSLFASNKPVDIITLAEQLREVQAFDKIGGLRRIGEIASIAYSSAFVKNYADTLKEYYNRRRAIQYAQELIASAYDGSIIELAGKLGDIPNFEQAAKDKNTGALLQDAVVRVQERFNDPNKKQSGLLTGLADLDYQIGGLRPEETIFLTAEPNVGKSLLALQICIKTALDGLTAAYFNFEMSERSIGDRTLAMALPLDTKAIHTPSAYLTQEDKALIDNTNIDKRLDNTLFIYTNTPPTSQAVLSKCKQLRAKGKPPALIVIDYIQLMDADGKSPMEKIENISRGLKRIAKEFYCPIIAISSLSKDGKMRHSYQLEFDADVVLFMSTDKDSFREYGNNCDIKPVQAEIKKNRNGRVGGTVELALSLKYLKFRGRSK